MDTIPPSIICSTVTCDDLVETSGGAPAPAPAPKIPKDLTVDSLTAELVKTDTIRPREVDGKIEIISAKPIILKGGVEIKGDLTVTTVVAPADAVMCLSANDKNKSTTHFKIYPNHQGTNGADFDFQGHRMSRYCILLMVGSCPYN